MIRTDNLNVDLGMFHLVDVSIDVAENEFFALMGPTGAGKTVLLEAIAGLIDINRGRVWIGGRDVTRLPPEKRGVGIVYQDFSLFPHMTVLENIVYGLRFHHVPKAIAAERLERLGVDLNLRHLFDRLPTNLSGGENQRAALARALMINPSVLLLDEPLSALDPRFREEMRDSLKTLHRHSTTTFLMVTHDFAEALSLADRAAIMNDGKIEQTGTVEDIFRRPRSTFVADFVGMKNLFAASFSDGGARINGIDIDTGDIQLGPCSYIAIRPEDIVVSREPLRSSMRNSFTGTVTALIDRGLYYEVCINAAGIPFKAAVTKRSLFELGIREGENVFFSFKATALHCF
ncbi:MAG: Fe3+/spermidine/putrescine ABC transporter ATP-binding protein [delta proteobacterium MLS_D]|jgi:molybdate/tungstate transport system ATP-binding protein|nr:MAG: Fe3+/spermidine/putrescine ABC transporter ATP-binding protein [delta proteobacterium MLS_D]